MASNGDKELPYKSDWDHYTLVATGLPTTAWEDVMKNGVMHAGNGNIRDMARFSAAGLILVLPTSAAHFAVKISYGEDWKRDFLVNDQLTLYDLARAIKAATGLFIKNQRLVLVPRQGEHGTMEAYFPRSFNNALRSMHSLGLSDGSMVQLYDDAEEYPDEE